MQQADARASHHRNQLENCTDWLALRSSILRCPMPFLSRAREVSQNLPLMRGSSWTPPPDALQLANRATGAARVAQPFSSRLSSSRNCQSVPSARSVLGLDLIIPTSWSRSAKKRMVSSAS